MHFLSAIPCFLPCCLETLGGVLGAQCDEAFWQLLVQGKGPGDGGYGILGRQGSLGSCSF